MTYQLDDLMQACVDRGASDLHLTAGRPPVLRIHGRLVDMEGEVLEESVLRDLVGELAGEKARAEMADVGGSDFGLAFKDGSRFRVSVFRSKGGYRAVLRLIPSEMLSFDEIGVPEAARELCSRPQGLFLVTGPTGSGKTTTLASMVHWINTNQDRHIVTIEDPIEYEHSNAQSIITQREIGRDVEGFGEAMRRVLRQDPEVILLGEMRDLETIAAAITAAETGHLVFATLHTTGSARTVDRIIDAFPPDQQDQIRVQLSVSLIAVLSQVLLPRADGPGRVAAFELMLRSSAIENLIRKNETFKIPSVIQTSKAHGMVLLDDSLAGLVASGAVAAEVAREFASDRAQFTG